MMTAQKAIGHVLHFEGGYVHDPKDAGGETNFGISKRSYPDLDIKNLTKLDAVAIYEADYWLPLRCDNLPSPLALPVLDAGVNMGSRTAIKLLQGALDSAAVVVDGVIGPKTLEAVWGHPHIDLLLARFTLARIERHTRIVSRRKSQQKFLAGWVHRAIKAHKMEG